MAPPWWAVVLTEMVYHEQVLSTIPGMLQLLSIADFKGKKRTKLSLCLCDCGGQRATQRSWFPPSTCGIWGWSAGHSFI